MKKSTLFEALGTYTWADGDKYVGEWKDDKANGHGTCTWATGNQYVGEWKDHKLNGQGTQTWADGKMRTGIWVNRKCIETLSLKPIISLSHRTPSYH